MTKALALIPAALLAALFISACGGNDGSASQSTAQTGQSQAVGNPSSTSAGGCSIVDSQAAADALGGSFVSSRQFADAPAGQVKCAATFDIGGAQRAFSVWQMPATDYEPLKAAEEDPVTDVAGIGDKAFVAFHPDSQRYDMAAVKTGKFTVQVLGDDQEQVKKLVGVIISQY